MEPFATPDFNEKINRLINKRNLKEYSCFIGAKTLDKNLSFEEVQIQTLEDFIVQNKLVKIDFLKMDCEGAEYSILESTPKHIFDMITTISMEFHDLKNKNISPEDLIKKLIQNDFEIVKYKYEKTSMNLNYGKIIGTKILKSINLH